MTMRKHTKADSKPGRMGTGKVDKDGKVECLYRTTTTKSENIKSGTVLLEAQVYPSFKDKKDVPVTKKKRETRPSQKNLNDKNARRYLITPGKYQFWERGYLGHVWVE